ncbi:hypothetical protein VU01_11572 [Candidatus Electrothrix marina]|uniref:Uncharacterized protein n=1 Tax=Candidatus Electrothrix marina TaxID=1859130 RepID=A0A444JE19_9BACT|nr:hypothetical protein VU01_11572 [Candidatus Electrothrix marina]
MNKHFYRIIACSVFFFSPIVQGHAQNSLSPAEQKRQEMMETTMLKETADNLRQNTALSEEEKGYMFRFKMRKMMQERMRQSGESIWGWEPTEWQKTLPNIRVQDGGAIQEYSFTDLINADGYLCPGSARAYKALEVALPLLYKGTTPVKGDFKITHGAALCTSLVYDYFMQGYTDKEHLELDMGIKKKLITIECLSTGKKVTVVFPPSTIRGHDSAAAEAGDVILHAKEGEGMTIHVEKG